MNIKKRNDENFARPKNPWNTRARGVQSFEPGSDIRVGERGEKEASESRVS